MSLNEPLILVRAVHLATTLSVAGTISFRVLIAEPALRFAGDKNPIPSAVRAQFAWMIWIGLSVLVITGMAWLVLVSEQMVDLPLGATLSQGMIWTVLGDTDFGRDWAIRLLLAALLAVMLGWDQVGRSAGSQRKLGASAVIAAGLAGTLAWAGHAAANSGPEGDVHLCADILHLIAAAAWVGALVPLALLLRAARRTPNETSIVIARAAAWRFSTVGVVSVGALITTGVVNSWVLVGSMPALINTDYGRLLLVKVALFMGMLSVAAVNRLQLTPYLRACP